MTTPFGLATTAEYEAIPVLHAPRELDVEFAPEFRQLAREAVDACRFRLVVDMSATQRVDTTGLGVLFGIRRAVERHGGWVRIAALNPPVLGRLQRTKHFASFLIFRSVEDALRLASPHPLADVGAFLGAWADSNAAQEHAIELFGGYSLTHAALQAVYEMAANYHSDLDDLGMPESTARALKRGGVITIAQLVRKTRGQLIELKGLNLTRVTGIESALERHGFALSKEASTDAA